MEAAIQILRSNYVYTQILRLIGQNHENFENRVFLAFISVGKRETCLLERERERDLSIGKREICVLARERSV